MIRKPILLIAFVLLLAGCATQPRKPAIILPPVAQPATQRHNPGQVIWHDLATRDLEQAKAFYGDLFGWTFEQLNPGGRQYTVVYLQGIPIGGMFTFSNEDSDKGTGEWLINLSSANVARDANLFEKAGGKVLEPAREAPNRGTAAFVRDPQQAVMILTNSSSGDPEEGNIPQGGWLWNELWTHDVAAAESFYTEVFEYDAKQLETGGEREYILLEKDGVPLGGILQLLDRDVRPHWVPFIRVENIQDAVAKAIELGAKVLIEPDPAIREGKVSLLLGPGGEPVVLQEFQFQNN